ncbi:DUF2851 family protein [Myroides sp. DF42-4-2]|uniref:DUF2851 family protein n=1 Tax=unclassified Myroides TaxID=2642485 RepID=UPI002574D13B|nr:DUF2851 family protein [Myroides sp. DF42-4-2]MDM1407719.1 DUF2851 family protein [Myroides sp. DF42-4-2]
MKEAFVQYVWNKQLFTTLTMRTAQQHLVTVQHPGQWSSLAGPDFFYAQITLDGQRWIGNVEVHLQSSDWYRHHHQNDARYDNVILHVVWDYDMPVFNSKGSEIPTLVVADYVQKQVMYQVEKLLAPKTTINCQTLLKDTLTPIEWSKWKETLYIERLQDKAKQIEQLLQETTYNWNQVLFCLVAKSFGLNVNGDAFFEMAKALPIQILLKEGEELMAIEALFFGMAGLLQEEEEVVDRYYWDLVGRWRFYQHKYQLQARSPTTMHFFKLRPPNFPTIRLAQLASWFFKHKYQLGQLLETRGRSHLQHLVQAEVSPYWETHYTFYKESKPQKKEVTLAFQELLLLNTVIPMQYVWACHKNREEEVENITALSAELKAESNAIVALFEREDVVIDNAFDSQALIQLKKTYCDVNKCLSCAIGRAILNKKN